MKKSLILVGILSIGYANSQTGKIGINTQKPNATLDVKAKTNNGSKVLELQNSAEVKLVSILDNGNVGIGTITPSLKLEVVSSLQGKGFRLKDGSESKGRVLTSDANGNAIWEAPKTSFIVGEFEGVYGATIDHNNKNDWHYTNIKITLPTGKWLVTGAVAFYSTAIQQMMIGALDGVWVQSTFSDTKTANTKSKDIEGTSHLISGGQFWRTPWGILSGAMVINNKSTSSKTYYLMVSKTHIPTGSTVEIGGSTNAENNIYATKIN